MTRVGEAKECLARYDQMTPEERDALPLEQRIKVDRLRSTLPVAEKTLRLAIAADGVDYDTGGPVEPAVTEWAKGQLASEIANYNDSAMSAKKQAMESFTGYAETKIEETLRDPSFQEEVEEARIASENENPYLKDIPVAYNDYITVQADEGYLKIRSAIHDNPDKYAEHKDVIDRMMTAYLDAWNLISQEQMRLTVLFRHQQDANDSKNEVLESAYSDYINYSSKRVGPVENRMASLQHMMRYMLEGKELTEGTSWMHAHMEKEFGVVTERRREEKNELSAAEEKLTKLEKIEKLGGSKDFADFYSDDALRIAEELDSYNRRHSNFVKDLLPDPDELRRLNIDPRALRIFAHGYEVNEDGDPSTEEDRRYKEADEQYVREYTSSDPAVKARQLDRITDEMLLVAPTDEMISEEYILQNVVQIKQMVEKLCYLENIMNENKEYFENLPKEKLSRLHAIMNLYVPYGGLMTSILLAHGVNQNGCTLVKQVDAASPASLQAGISFMKGKYEERLAEYYRAEAGIGAGSQGVA
jgi:hypothetical protein